MEKVLLINKPAGWTSFDVVAKVRNYFKSIDTMTQSPKSEVRSPRIKVGHAGTLDPFATGLLIVLVGKEATKKQDEYMKKDKEYEAILELGKVSTTGDPEGEISKFPINNSQFPKEKAKISKNVILASEKSPEPEKLKIEVIEQVINDFLGEIEQVPPIHSAIKINGRRAYELARKGIEVEMKPRKVTIYDLEILDYKWPFLTLRIKCSSGTYIRSLAKDIGEALGYGAYLTELKRTKIGKYDLKDASAIEQLT